MADVEAMLAAPWSSDEGVAWPVTRLLFDGSAIAYEEKATGLPWLERLGLSGHLLSGRGVEAYPMHVWAIRAGRHGILAFRGTQSGGSILQDLKVIQRKTPDGRLHAGFADGYADIHDAVITRLRRDGVTRVWLTGHSLGGALAVVAGMQLADAGIDVAGVMTFGQPMVAMPDLARVLARRFRGRYVAFVNRGDPVPRLVLPYVHFGRCVRDDDEGIRRFDRVPRTFGMAPPGGAGSDGAGERHDDDLGPMNAEDLEALIERAEAEEAAPTVDAQGRIIARGLFNPFQGHSLAAYGALVDRFLTAGRA